MNLALSGDKEFLGKITEIILANLENENFGVKELAQMAGLRQSYLRRRLNKISNKSVSRFISEVRLQKAMEILREGDLTAAEVAYKVGFGSTTYFHKNFHEFYGFPPGEVKKRGITQAENDNAVPDAGNLEPVKERTKPLLRRKIIVVSSVSMSIIVLGCLVYAVFFRESQRTKNDRYNNPDKSIAILPFKTLSVDKGNQYFADGVMEDILSSLNRIGSIRVISRTSVEQYRESTEDVREIAKKLGVRYILEGSVQQHDEKVRIRVQLIDAKHDRHILSETYDRELADIFVIQSSIALQVADKLETVLSPEETKQIEKIPTRSAEAYTHYLKGRYFWQKRTKEGFLKSIEYFEKATQADPNYALAWAGLGDGYLYLTWYNWFEPSRKEGFEKAKKIALKALELDSNLSEAHVLMGNILFWHEWKWQEAEKELAMAVRLNPDNSLAQWIYAELLDVLCKKKDARKHLDLALKLDPVFYLPYSTSGLLYYNEGNFKKSLEECRKSLELNAVYGGGYQHGWQCYFHMGKYPQAIEYLITLYHISHADSLRLIYSNKGMTGVLDWMIEHKYEQSDPVYSSFFYLMADRKEEALKCLEKGFEIHDLHMVRIISWYDFKNLQTEARYLEIVKKMGLMDYYNKAKASGQLPQ